MPRAEPAPRCQRCGYLELTRIHDESSSHPSAHRFEPPGYTPFPWLGIALWTAVAILGIAVATWWAMTGGPGP